MGPGTKCRETLECAFAGKQEALLRMRLFRFFLFLFLFSGENYPNSPAAGSNCFNSAHSSHTQSPSVGVFSEKDI